MRSTRSASNRQEKQVASVLGMKRQPNSGATSFMKGDVIGADILVECKTLMKPQQTRVIEKKWFRQLMEEKVAMRKALMAVVFDFGDGDQFVAMPIREFKMLYDKWQECIESEEEE